MKKAALTLTRESLRVLRVATGIQAGGSACSTCTHASALCDTTGNTGACLVPKSK